MKVLEDRLNKANFSAFEKDPYNGWYLQDTKKEIAIPSKLQQAIGDLTLKDYSQLHTFSSIMEIGHKSKRHRQKHGSSMGYFIA